VARSSRVTPCFAPPRCTRGPGLQAKNQGDKTKLEECLQTYPHGAELYEKY